MTTDRNEEGDLVVHQIATTPRIVEDRMNEITDGTGIILEGTGVMEAFELVSGMMIIVIHVMSHDVPVRGIENTETSLEDHHGKESTEDKS